MQRLSLTTPIISILPVIALIPVLGGLLVGIHSGGLHILFEFLYASLHPSLDPPVLQSAFKGLQITIATALLSWVISTFAGLILGIFSSYIVWQILGFSRWQAILIKRFLAIPRSIHELIWGLLLLQFFGMSPWVAIIAICIPYSSLVSRVISDQIDSIDDAKLIALRHGGAKPLSALITTILPPMIPVINIYGGYRLECALRGATLLGVFGLGGIGTELQFTLQSLEFREMWTSLWMLGFVMISLEKLLSWWRTTSILSNKSELQLLISIAIMLSTTVISLIWLQKLDINILSNLRWHPIPWPTISELRRAFHELSWIKLISETVLITLLAAGIAIGTPPLGMTIWPTKTGLTIQSYIWLLLRLIPPPLTVLLLLLCTSPNIFVAALALGLQNLGIMGRLLKEKVDHQNNNLFEAIKSSGSGNGSNLLYGYLSPQSKSYLAYAAYRTDVLLRETAVVGVVGGAGLGWQLQESLSSFDWAQIALITTSYSTLTLIGEALSEKVRDHWLYSTTRKSQNLMYLN